jgi:hypothetical protein
MLITISLSQTLKVVRKLNNNEELEENFLLATYRDNKPQRLYGIEDYSTFVHTVDIDQGERSMFEKQHLFVFEEVSSMCMIPTVIPISLSHQFTINDKQSRKMFR